VDVGGSDLAAPGGVVSPRPGVEQRRIELAEGWIVAKVSAGLIYAAVLYPNQGQGIPERWLAAKDGQREGGRSPLQRRA
jgi:hypothetical protein